MQTHSAQPTAGRIASLLWFPFFFAAAFALLGLLAFAHPSPDGLQIGVVGSSSHAVTPSVPSGIEVVAVPDESSARSLVASGDLAAATDGTTLFVASAASATRVGYVTAVFERLGGPPLTVVDVNPLAPGDVSGVGLFFYALPNLLVGLITSIVLLQFGMWPMRKKVLTIAATGAFSAVFSYLLASTLQVIPSDVGLIGYAFLLTQAIGWLTTAAAIYAKQFFMPVAMTFVLILGIPSSGGTVNRDMLPGWIQVISDWHPFAQFIELARAEAYLGSSPTPPLAVLSGWAVLGAGLLVVHSIRDRAPRAARNDPTAAASSLPVGRLDGTISSASGVPVPHALVLILDEHGMKRHESRTDDTGGFAVTGLATGTFYVLAAAEGIDPALGTIRVTDHSPAHSLDMTVTAWRDPANATYETE